jgi:arsenate reductase
VLQRAMTQRVLFLCTHNSARSQMAEGLLRYLSAGSIEAHSAGTEATEVRPLALKAMREIGIDVAGQTSKTLDQYINDEFDAVITVCDSANESCPFFPNAKQRLHWSFPDPSQAQGTPEQQLDTYREVRDGLRSRIVSELLPGLRLAASAPRPKHID